MAKALTVKAVEAATPGTDSHGKVIRREIPDGLVVGLRLVIQPSGARSWVLRYRSPVELDTAGNPKQCKLTLGTVIDLADADAPDAVRGGPLTLAGARKIAREALTEIAAGRDPAAEKRRDGEERKSGDDLFPAIAAKFIAKRKAKKSWRETAMYLGLKEDAEGKLIPTGKRGRPTTEWKAKRVQDITDHDVLDLIDSIEGPVAQNRMLAWLHVTFEWMRPRYVKANPAAGLKRPTEESPRDRVLTDDEVRDLWKATETLGSPFGPMVRVLLLTGCRLREVAQMEWRELDLDGAVWHLPAARAKNGDPHDIALAPAVLEIIKAMPRIGTRYVFTTNGSAPVSGFSRMKTRLDKLLSAMRADDPEGEAPDHWTLHDLRRVVASGMAKIGIPVHVAEKCLSHKSGTFKGITAVYQMHEFAPEQATAWKAWARFVDLIQDRSRFEGVVNYAHLYRNDDDSAEPRREFHDAIQAGGERWEGYLRIAAGEDDAGNVVAFQRAEG